MIERRTIVSLSRIDPEANMARFYAAWIECDLFGQVCLMTQWGRIGSWGRLRAQPCEGAAQAHAALERTIRRKKAKSYTC
jgi:predicted DNA-binding WGR domain protein